MSDLFSPPAPPILRPYQLDALEQIDAVFRAGNQSPLLVLPTGSGKTIVAAELMRRAEQAGRSILFLAPRRELVHQASAKLSALGVRHGVLLAGAERLQDGYARIQIASIDTLAARFARGRLTDLEADLVVVDEAHLSITQRKVALLDRWPSARRVGLTATPTRKDGRALGVIYDSLIEPVTVAGLTMAGYLVPARYFSLSEPDLARVQTLAGDYNQGQLEAAVNRTELVGDIVQTWLARAGGRRTVVFCVSVAHSAALAGEFLRAGIVAEHVDGRTPTETRDQIFARFRSGETRVLTNCDVATYGFDLPELSCVVLARPTKSLMRYLQMLGRGLRPAEGKRDCLVLDHSGGVHLHGFATDDRSWTLEGHKAMIEVSKREREKKETRQLDCPECHATFLTTRRCPECGYELEPVGRRVETLEGELIEVGGSLDESEVDRLQFYIELLGVAAERGWKPGAAFFKFREKFGEDPPREWRRYPAARPSEETRRWVQSRVIAWAKSRDRSHERNRKTTDIGEICRLASSR